MSPAEMQQQIATIVQEGIRTSVPPGNVIAILETLKLDVYMYSQNAPKIQAESPLSVPINAGKIVSITRK